MTKRKSSDAANVPILDSLRGEFYESVAEVLRVARAKAFRFVNFVMVEAYWNVGRMIVEEEQQGKERAEYGKALIRNLSARLTSEFGAGFGVTNLAYFRQFYLAFPIFHTVCGRSPCGVSVPDNQPAIRYTLRSELSWSHYRLLIRVEKPAARDWYMTEAAEQNWSVRALERQIDSLYYERLLMSGDKAPVIEEMRNKTTHLSPTPQDFIKDPYVLEFLGLQDSPAATPAGAGSVRSAYRGCRSAQPPANGWQPVGLHGFKPGTLSNRSWAHRSEPGGFQAISRWLSERQRATPPDTECETNPHPGGVPEAARTRMSALVLR